MALPVAEVFGPTVQGEGPDAGRPAYFVRLGGCDYRCSWCDSLHAVEPALVRQLPRESAHQLANRVDQLRAGPTLVVLTGGNPALLELGDLVAELHRRRFEVAVETQGSVWRDWLRTVDALVISPKGPTSGMDSEDHRQALTAFLAELEPDGCPRVTLKVVIFDQEDLAYAVNLHATEPEFRMMLSVGTDVGLTEATTIQRVRARYRWICEEVARRREMADVHVLPQLHVLAWGTARGV